LCKEKGIFTKIQNFTDLNKKKVQQADKPGSVIPQGGISIIYLSGLPPGIGRATLYRRYTWPCNP